jgi:hypothetical protein
MSDDPAEFRPFRIESGIAKLLDQGRKHLLMPPSEIVDSEVEISVNYLFHRHNFHAPALRRAVPSNMLHTMLKNRDQIKQIFPHKINHLLMSLRF